jgi:hypothetical protein
MKLLHVTAIFWTSTAIGFLLPAAFEVRYAHEPLAVGIEQWAESLFDQFGMNMWVASPFVITAILALFHLMPRSGESCLVVRSRGSGVLGAILAGAALYTWILAGVWTSKSSTAAITIVFLPILAMIVMPAAYGGGRMLAYSRRNTSSGL